MENTIIKAIDVNAKEWFDKVNGNSYFSAEITIDFIQNGQPMTQNVFLPFQYGYGEYYLQATIEELKKLDFIDKDFKSHLYIFCKDKNISLSYFKHENCKKRELKN